MLMLWSAICEGGRLWEGTGRSFSMLPAKKKAVSASKKKFCIPGYSASALPTHISSFVSDILL